MIFGPISADNRDQDLEHMKFAELLFTKNTSRNISFSDNVFKEYI